MNYPIFEESLDIQPPPIAENRLSFDIGGTLIKAVVFHPGTNSDKPGRLSMFTFPISNMEEFITYVKSWSNHEDKAHPGCFTKIMSTGLGYRNFKQRMPASLNTEIRYHVDECACNVAGWRVLMNHLSPTELFYADPEVDPPVMSEMPQGPFILVNIGSGVTVIKVAEDGSYTLVTGSNRGGRTFMGLTTALIGSKSYDDAIDLAEKGDHQNVNNIMSDCYGGGYPGVADEAVASYFGKVAYDNTSDAGRRPSNEDFAAAALTYIAADICHITQLCTRITDTSRIVFAGTFISRAIVRKELKRQITGWTMGAPVPVWFLKHSSYLGSIGALFEETVCLDNSNDILPTAKNAVKLI